MSASSFDTGRGLDRRDALRTLGAGALALVTPASRTAMPAPASSCVATPEQTEGPFFVDERLNRADIRSDPATGTLSQGVPLALQFVVHAVSATGCALLPGAVVDVWQCDAAGRYSAVDASAKQKFLRGYQIADADGTTRFTTIVPGWYPGRAAHIHFKIRGEAPTRGRFEFTSQLYFDDAVVARIHARKPYAGSGSRNANDFIYRDGGRALMLALVESGDGYAGRFDVTLRMP